MVFTMVSTAEKAPKGLKELGKEGILTGQNLSAEEREFIRSRDGIYWPISLIKTRTVPQMEQIGDAFNYTTIEHYRETETLDWMENCWRGLAEKLEKPYEIVKRENCAEFLTDWGSKRHLPEIYALWYVLKNAGKYATHPRTQEKRPCVTWDMIGMAKDGVTVAALEFLSEADHFRAGKQTYNASICYATQEYPHIDDYRLKPKSKAG